MNFITKLTDRFNITLRNIETYRLQQKVKAAKLVRSQAQYNSNPEVTVILQFFNKRRNIKPILNHLRLSGVEEIIVIDDGSIDGSHQEWLKYLDQPNDFLLHCNDLYEVRTYDRAISMARGKYVCLLQDDDLPPPDPSWIENAVTLFEHFPKLLLLGGREGVDILIPESADSTLGSQYKQVGNIHEWTGYCKYQLCDQPIHSDPISGIPFMFTMTVNRAPVFLRREAFICSGGINQKYAPYQCDDVDSSIQAWLQGFEVGLYSCGFQRGLGQQGMKLYNSQTRGQVMGKNWQTIYEQYYEVIASGYLETLVEHANQVLSPATNRK